jgi:hypothetical protein
VAITASARRVLQRRIGHGRGDGTHRRRLHRDRQGAADRLAVTRLPARNGGRGRSGSRGCGGASSEIREGTVHACSCQPVPARPARLDAGGRAMNEILFVVEEAYDCYYRARGLV